MFMVNNDPRRQKNLPELPPFYLNNTRIKQVHKTNYLGLTVDDSLNWNERYRSVKGKVVGGLASPRNLKNILALISVTLRVSSASRKLP